MPSRKPAASTCDRSERLRNDENVDTSQQRYQLRRDGPVQLPIEEEKREKSKERKIVPDDEKQRRVERLQEAQKLRKQKQAEVSELRRKARIKRTTYKGTMTQKRTSAHLDQIINAVAARVLQPVEEIVREHFDDDFNASPAKQQRKLPRKERVFREQLELAIAMSERKPEVAEMPKPAAPGDASQRKRVHSNEEATSSKDARPRLDDTEEAAGQEPAEVSSDDNPPVLIQEQEEDDVSAAEGSDAEDGAEDEDNVEDEYSVEDDDSCGYDDDEENYLCSTCGELPSQCICAPQSDAPPLAPPSASFSVDSKPSPVSSVEIHVSASPSDADSPQPTVGQLKELIAFNEELMRENKKMKKTITDLENLCQRQQAAGNVAFNEELIKRNEALERKVSEIDDLYRQQQDQGKINEGLTQLKEDLNRRVKYLTEFCRQHQPQWKG